MSEDACDHQWGEAELCETRLGNIMSPVCKHCGAAKLVEEARRPAAPRADLAPLLTHKEGPCFWYGTRVPVTEPKPGNAPDPILVVRTNMPPPGAPRVHPFQSEMFTDL